MLLQPLLSLSNRIPQPWSLIPAPDLSMTLDEKKIGCPRTRFRIHNHSRRSRFSQLIKRRGLQPRSSPKQQRLERSTPRPTIDDRDQQPMLDRYTARKRWKKRKIRRFNNPSRLEGGLTTQPIGSWRTCDPRRC